MRTVMLVLALLLAQAAHAAEVAGVKVDDRVHIGMSELVLTGAGLRTRLIFKVYVGALYLAQKKKTAAEALSLAGPKRVSMTLLRSLSADQLVGALDEGLRANHTEAQLAPLKERIDRLAGIMRDI